MKRRSTKQKRPFWAGTVMAHWESEVANDQMNMTVYHGPTKRYITSEKWLEELVEARHTWRVVLRWIIRRANEEFIDEVILFAEKIKLNDLTPLINDHRESYTAPEGEIIDRGWQATVLR